ncbi:MAG: septum formation initiator family protein [Acidipropionibacterium sp.]|nr:septum formation initiator family protein [Acidipropionibacterium sp.]
MDAGRGQHRGQHQSSERQAGQHETGQRRPDERPNGGVQALGGLGRLSLTSRAFILAAAVVMVFVMITPSLGVYFRQRSELADLNAQQTRTSQQITDLQDELKRWDDPGYVQTQARSQLGWVMPGETGYRVIGKDGKVLGQGAGLDASGDAASATQASPWWQKLAGSVRTADAPARSTGQR